MGPFNPDHFTDMDGKPIEEAGDPQACPFCGSGADQLIVERWSAEDDPDASFHVECLKCACSGPQADTQLEAAQAWNTRSG
jgi:Lar family restriction alleviation protein